jgi:hypothetical protein
VHDREAPSTPVDLRAIYKKVYDIILWPEPIPAPDQVTFRWKREVTWALGSCCPDKKVISINRLYQDGRLYDEITDLMAHEAAHFIWHGHPKAFKEFLRRAGIASGYINGQAKTSETYKAVEADWLGHHRPHSLHLGSLRHRPVPAE